MLRYLLTLLLINTYSGCYGTPIRENNGTISSLLESLANQCPNKFLNNRIKSKLEECKVSYDSSYNKEQFLCLMFYDINKQLCDYSMTRLLVLDESAKKLNEKLLLATACDQAKSWTASDIKESPEYKKNFEVVFQNPTQCAVACGSETILSTDVNFYCKYFKWGSDALSPDVKTEKIEKLAYSGRPQDIIPPNIADKESKPEISSPTIQAVQEALKDTNSTVANSTRVSIIPTAPHMNSTAVDETPVIRTEPVAQQSSSDDQPLPNDEQNKLGIKKATKNTEMSLRQPPSVSPSSDDLPSGQEEPPRAEPKEADVTKPRDSIQTPKKPALNDQLNGSEYDETDDEDTNTDTDGGENDSQFSLNQNGQQELQGQDRGRLVEDRERQEPVPAIDNSQYETDDDHFFPFFLTGVISVVVLYVLYHNKSKVTKVVLGLIVEGRQPGRRRNSRGHAYKRLDTLEQAMSANSAAPPSKIIY